MEVIKCKVCMEAFENELNLILHFNQSHLDSDYSEDDSLASDTSGSEEVSEDESEQCEHNELMSFLTDFEKDLLHSAYSVAEEEGFLNVDDLSVPSHDKIKDEEGSHQDQLDPNSFITEYEWRLLESSSSRADAEGIVEVDEKLLEEGRNCSQSSVSHKKHIKIDPCPASASSTGTRRKLPVRRCKQAVPEERSPLDKVRQLLPRLKPTQKNQLESRAETKSDEDDDNGIENDNKWKCYHKGCNKFFADAYHLNRHIKIHTTNPHMCAICKRNFRKPYVLEVHILTHHKEGGKNRLECESCHKRFSGLYSLRRHIRTYHISSNTPTYVCNQCQKVFLRKETLKEHMKTHSESSKFHCDLCDHRIATRWGFVKHKEAHNKVCFPCKMCEKKFIRMTDLKSHCKINEHSSPKTLSSHIKLRQGKFGCQKCNKLFLKEDALVAHIIEAHKEP